MALLYILTGHKATDDVMRTLDLNYMRKEDYGDHIEQTQHGPSHHVTIDGGDRTIHVLAHGDEQSIAGQSGKDFAKRMLDTFGKDQLSNRTILIYACNVAQGGSGSVLQAIAAELKEKKVKKAPLVGSVDQTFTMSTGTMMVLKDSRNADKLSKQVEGLRGHARDEAAEPYLRAFQDGWRGYKIRDDGHVEALNAEAAGNYIRSF